MFTTLDLPLIVVKSSQTQQSLTLSALWGSSIS